MDEFFSFNPGLPSRFPHNFVFEDFGAFSVTPRCAAHKHTQTHKFTHRQL
jgi:hypothetical protein